MTSRHDSGTSRDATAMPYIGVHHRQCARCSGYIDAASSFYQVTKFGPGRTSAGPADFAVLYFDGLDCLAAYASAQDEAFPVRDRKQVVAPYVLRYCDWCKDYGHLTGKPFGLKIESCNHPECQCWCGGT